MSVKLLTEHHLEFLSLKGSSDSTVSYFCYEPIYFWQYLRMECVRKPICDIVFCVMSFLFRCFDFLLSCFEFLVYAFCV